MFGFSKYCNHSARRPIARYNKPLCYVDRRDTLSPPQCLRPHCLRDVDPDATSTVLINTSGGVVRYSEEVIDLIKRLRGDFGIESTAIAGPVAGSAGADIFLAGKRREALRHSVVVPHQHFQCNKHGDVVGLVAPRDFFRRQLVNFLYMNVDDPYVEVALNKASRAFLDRQNYLDDVEMRGWELKRFGLVESAPRNHRQLADEFERRSQWPRATWPARIKNFFRMN